MAAQHRNKGGSRTFFLCYEGLIVFTANPGLQNLCPHLLLGTYFQTKGLKIHWIKEPLFLAFNSLLSLGCKVKLTQLWLFWLQFGSIPVEGAVA